MVTTLKVMKIVNGDTSVKFVKRSKAVTWAAKESKKLTKHRHYGGELSLVEQAILGAHGRPFDWVEYVDDRTGATTHYQFSLSESSPSWFELWKL